MAFVESRTTFPSFKRSRDYFRTGRGGPPEINIGGGAGAGAPGGITAPSVTAPPQAPPQAPPPVTQPVTQPAAQITQPAAQPIELGYQTAGPTESRLFTPVKEAAGAGEQQLTEFADLFRTQAGPSRTFEGIKAPETLETAITGGPMQPAQELVGAQYTGPEGLDPGAAGGLMHLSGQLKARQQALGTGGGIASTLTQSAPGITGGEARFTARDILDPGYRARLQEATAGVDPFAGRLEEEILGTQAFAQQRRGEEEAIAAGAREYLGGRRTGITSDIQAEIDAALSQQLGTQGAFADIQEAEGFQGQLAALQDAQQMGAIPAGVDLSALNTEARQALTAAGKARENIMAKYDSVSHLPLGVPGVGKRGKPSPFVRDAQGNLLDYRDVIPKELWKDWTARQADLEVTFNPLRKKWMEGRPEARTGVDPELLRTVSPLYYGGGPGDPAFAGGFEGPQVTSPDYLTFDPGVRPSRGNISTDDQRKQFNNINELLGDLDRISQDESPFRAASMAVNLEQYLDDEADALEARKEDLDETGKQWANQVRKLRKDYKKKKKKEEWGKIASVVGGTLGAVAGGIIGGPGGAVVGTSVGSQLGGSLA